MPAWLKVLLGIGCGLVPLFFTVGVGGFFYIRNHKDEWFAAAQKAQEDGKAFAAGKSASDCVDDSLKRVQECSGIPCEVRVRSFLRGCLDASAPSPQMCDAVPPRTEIIRSAKWTLDECARRGLPRNQPCTRLLQELQGYCERQSHR